MIAWWEEKSGKIRVYLAGNLFVMSTKQTRTCFGEVQVMSD